MSFKDVSAYQKSSSALVVPLGGLEPFGPSGALGLSAACVEAVLSTFCTTHKLLLAPPINFSCSKPYKSFEGSAGVRPNTLCNLILEICEDWIFQGFTRILIVNPSEFNDEPLALAAKRLNKHKECVRVAPFHTYVKNGLETVSGKKHSGESGRPEPGFLSLAAYCKPELIREEYSGEKSFSFDEKSYKMWYRRGKDPQKFRKMFPEALLSLDASQYNASQGKLLFDYIVNLFEKEHSTFLIPDPNDLSV